VSLKSVLTHVWIMTRPQRSMDSNSEDTLQVEPEE